MSAWPQAQTETLRKSEGVADSPEKRTPASTPSAVLLTQPDQRAGLPAKIGIALQAAPVGSNP